MQIISQVLFGFIAFFGLGIFVFQFSKISQSIRLGKDLNRGDRFGKRLTRMLLVAFGQQKMFKKPIPALLHGLVYVGFLIINIEVIEIMIDGVAGTHRYLGEIAHENGIGFLYDLVMASNEVLGFLVIWACIILLVRRNILKVERLHGPEMSRFPKLDANLILFTEIVLMHFLFLFNVSDINGGTAHHGVYPVSQPIATILSGINVDWHLLAKIGWWGHILGILLFMNYLPISKHFHIILAFPNTFASKLEPAGMLNSPENITHEIKAIMDPTYQVPEMEEQRLGAKEITDLSWTNLMDAYTCTECGRCTDVCPANITGKKLSPRKIVMATRDRLEELKSFGIETPEEANKFAEEKGTSLLGDYITPEELWACTTCNACTEACPVMIDHVTEIVDLRRYMVLEESSAPQELNIMMNNIENNGAPWAMPASARMDWAEEVYLKA